MGGFSPGRVASYCTRQPSLDTHPDRSVSVPPAPQPRGGCPTSLGLGRGALEACTPAAACASRASGSLPPSGGGPRVPRLWASGRPSPCHVPGPPSASPLAVPEAGASATILRPRRLRLTPAPLVPTRVASQGRAGGRGTPCLRAVCRCAEGRPGRRDTDGRPAGASAQVSRLSGGSPRVAPWPLWTQPIPHGGWPHRTTLQPGGRVPPPPPRGATGCAGGCSGTAWRARCTVLRSRRDRGDRASPRPRGERQGPATGPTVSKTSSVSVPPPWRLRQGEGTDRRFALWLAVPTPDDDDHSGTLGLASRRPSRRARTPHVAA
jgi:hypothetical protein